MLDTSLVQSQFIAKSIIACFSLRQPQRSFDFKDSALSNLEPVHIKEVNSTIGFDSKKMGSVISLVALVHIRCWVLPRKPSFPIIASTSRSQDRILCWFSCSTLLLPFETGILPQSSAPPGFDSLPDSFRVHSTPANMPWPPPDVLHGVLLQIERTIRDQMRVWTSPSYS